MSRPLFVRPLSEEEDRALAELIRGGEARSMRRAQIVRLSAEGHKASEIARWWQRSVQGVRAILHRFNAEGLASLADKPRRGRPRKTTERYVALLKEAVQTTPRDLGYPFSSWTLERLREHLGRETGVLLNPRYLSQLMARHDIVYRRPKHVMAHLRDQADYDEKKAVLEFLKKGRERPRQASNCCTSMSVKFISTRP